MPARINGIGTTYLGRHNPQSQHGVCENCGQTVDLQSYETRLWFTVFFIPIIPLGRKQILDDCPHCRQHHAAEKSDWEKVANDAVEEGMTKMMANKDDPAAAIELHGTYVYFQKPEEAKQLADAMLVKFGNDVDVQMHLGSWFEHVEKAAEANGAFQKAFELDPENPATQRAYGLTLAEEGRLTEASQILSSLKPPSEHYDPGIFYTLALAHQQHQEHEKAMDLFKLLLEETPELKKEKAIRQAIRESEAHVGTGESLVPTGPFFKSPWFLAGCVATILLSCLAMGNLYIARHRTVYVVNGLKTPITVQVDDMEKITIPATRFQTIALAEGQHQAQVITPQDLAPQITFRIKSDWFARFFKSPVFVLDPASSAIITWETTVYRVVPVDEGEYRFYIGQPFKTFDDIDYIFRDFPREISLDSADSATKTRVGLVDDAGPIELLALQPDALTGNELVNYLERHLRCSPDDESLLAYYVVAAAGNHQADRCLRFLRQRLEHRPVQIEWHRYYQSLGEVSSASTDLIAEYDAMLADDPGNSALLYLRGRLEATSDAAMTYLRRALDADASNFRAWAAMAYHAASSGDFQSALSSLDEALAIKPEQSDVLSQRRAMLLALGQSAVVERETRKILETRPLSTNAHYALMESLAIQHRKSDLDTAHQRYAQCVLELMPEDPHQLVSQSRQVQIYLNQEFELLLKTAQSLPDEQDANRLSLVAQLELGHLKEAIQAVEAIPVDQRGFLDLCFGVACRQQGNLAKANKWLEMAVERLGKGDTSQQFAAKLLQRDEDDPSTLADLRNVALRNAEKVVFLLAIAQRSRAYKEEILELADKLNYKREFPYYFAQRMIDQ